MPSAASAQARHWACYLPLLALSVALLPAAAGLDPVAKWYVAEDTLPPELLADTYAPDITEGDLLGPFHEQYWKTHWITFYPWYVIQMKNSPNRVYTYEEADFVFVPVCMGKCGRPWDVDSPRFNVSHDESFLKQAWKWLPQLGEKPHFIVINAAVDLPFGIALPEAEPFFFAGHERPEGPISDHNWRYIGAPTPSHEHFNTYAQDRTTAAPGGLVRPQRRLGLPGSAGPPRRV